VLASEHPRLAILCLAIVLGGCSQKPIVTRPRDPLVEARDLTRAGKPDEAYRRFEDILRDEPSNLTAHRGLVEAGYYAGKLSALERRYSELTRRKDMGGLGHYGLALIEVAHGPGHKEAALAQFHKAQERMPNESDVPYRIGLVHLMNGDPGQAESNLSQAMSLDPDRAGIRVALASALIQLGREQEAVEVMRRILVLSPSPEEARKARALASKIFDPLRAIPPDIATDLRNVTDRLAQDAVQQALSLVDKVISAHPEIPFAYTLKGLAHSRLENNGEAIVAFEQALKLKPGCPATLVGLGDVYARLKKWSQARAYFEQATQLDPLDVEAHQRMGDMAMSRSDPDRAAGSYSMLVLLAPERVDFRHKWAQALMVADQVQQAVTVYEGILEIKPGDMEALIRLGALHVMLGERDPVTRDAHRDSARRYLGKAHELNPDNQAVRDMLDKLEE
jgi:tetratricopeptide (TPR) repeat protein